MSAVTARGARCDGVYSCVVDHDPRFHLEALRWFAALTGAAGVPPDALVVHAVEGARSPVLDRLARAGVEVRAVARFDAGFPHANKVAGARSLAAARPSGQVVLTDADVAVLSDLRGLAPEGGVAGKLVDGPNPPVGVLRDALRAAGLRLPRVVPLEWMPRAVTFEGHLNGGVYVVDAACLPELAEAWERFARLLADRPSLLGRYATYLDQVAMTLALCALGLPVARLDARFNCPTHVPALVPPGLSPPEVLHYHDRVDRNGLLLATGHPALDAAVGRANDAIRAAMREGFPVATFFDWRYRTDPGLGSGEGSRGAALQAKRERLRRVAAALRPCTTLDVGCGDGEAVRGLDLGRYVGVDPSAEARRLARRARPDGELLPDWPNPAEADLVVCLDVLIHEPDPAAYRSLVARLARAARRALLVSGWESPPPAGSPIVFFHEPLSATLARVAPGLERHVLCVDDRGLATLCALRPPARRHPRDLDQAVLEAARSATTSACATGPPGPAGSHGPDPVAVPAGPDPLRLLELRLCAWETVGFYPAHPPRAWEYPVVADILLGSLPPRSAVLDVGAGVNPLVPYLSRAGLVVDTVDPGDDPQPGAAEWGFFDYGAEGLARRSFRCRLPELEAPPACYDAVVSVSVLEHLDAEERRAVLAAAGRLLGAGGLVVLTLDLRRGGEKLWDRRLGEVVEPEDLHGGLPDVLAECRGAGLEPVHVGTARGFPGLPVDVALVVARRDRS